MHKRGFLIPFQFIQAFRMVIWNVENDRKFLILLVNCKDLSARAQLQGDSSLKSRLILEVSKLWGPDAPTPKALEKRLFLLRKMVSTGSPIAIKTPRKTTRKHGLTTPDGSPVQPPKRSGDNCYEYVPEHRSKRLVTMRTPSHNDADELTDGTFYTSISEFKIEESEELKHEELKQEEMED
jgi:hypothetical protein